MYTCIVYSFTFIPGYSFNKRAYSGPGEIFTLNPTKFELIIKVILFELVYASIYGEAGQRA